MYLKSIEVQGFKSFANKINFEFHNGITCIVGPNGSGKSNVADAVRWVLGEQSAKQLRGANMQDVIFSGTELRKPQGYAYVAITLDNSDHKLNIDYEEVTVSRKVFRSGESEYKINGTVTRLRDVQELFYDTGIGKEGYSIIGQGQIDKILSNKPDERRELFDEAVGIVKFKRRKLMTLKKLDSEHASLVRVTDILNELEKQVGPLERQSENAKKYLKLRDELRELDRSLFTLDYKETAGKQKAVEDKQKIVLGDLSDTEKANEALTKQYDSVNQKMQSLEESIREKNDRINETSVQISNKEGEIRVAEEQVRTEENNETHAKERLLAISSEISRYEKEISEMAEAISRGNSEAEEHKNHLAELTEKLETLDQQISDHSGSVAARKSEIVTLLNKKSDVSARLQHFDTLKEQQKIRKGQISSRMLKLKSDREEIENRLTQASAEETKYASLLADQKNTLTEKNVSIDKLQKDLSEINEKRQNAEQQFHITRSRAESLKNLAERYEGFQGSIKKVMEYGSSRNMGIEGVVSELIRVEKKYETAIEIALGGAIQNIVTDSTDSAKKLIAYLKTNRLGRATFLPMDAYDGKRTFSHPEILKEEGVIGLADGLIQCDEKYRPVFLSLLGKTVIVDQIDHAQVLAKKYRYSVRMVTLEGDLFNIGGSLTGGAFKNSSNLLGRKREIEDLSEKAAQYEKDASSLKKEQIDLQNQLTKLINERNKLNTELQNTSIAASRSTLSKNQFSEKLAELDLNLTDAASEFQAIDKEFFNIDAEREAVLNSYQNIEQSNSDSENKIAEEEKVLEEEKQLRQKYLDELTNGQLAYNSALQKASFLEQSRQKNRGEIERLSYEKEQLDTRNVQIREEIDRIQASILALREEKEKEEKNLAEIRISLNSLNEEKTHFMSDQKVFFHKQQEISDRMKELEVEKLRLENQNEKLEEHLESQVSYIWNEYEMTPVQMMVPDDEIKGSMTELRKSTISLKQQIKGLGNVNVNAIEEYKEVAERYIFMKAQYEDLTKAEQTLLGIINELEEGMRKQFNEQFVQIQTRFDHVFQELFGGGHGRLELVEDEDVIEAGIRIISQPPGKKLQNMMQLSGGEKALTAIALLFAIQSLKPSPFCLLDEIEAALDDSNVSRFAGYLHKLTKDTQFILISHRRGTMMMADRLYGITMQEKGVSALVSVNMIEQDLDN